MKPDAAKYVWSVVVAVLLAGLALAAPGRVSRARRAAPLGPAAQP